MNDETKTEKFYLDRLPFLAEWEPELRAQFLEGMNKLQNEQMRMPPGCGPEDVVAVLALDPEQVSVRLMPRPICALIANDMRMLDSPTSPGRIHILILSEFRRCVIEAPLQFHLTMRPGQPLN